MEIEGWWFWRKKSVYVHICTSYTFSVAVEGCVNMRQTLICTWISPYSYLTIWYENSAQIYYFLHKRKHIWFISFLKTVSLVLKFANLKLIIIQNEIITVSIWRETPRLNHQYQSYDDRFRGETQQKVCREMQRISSFFLAVSLRKS